jgi:hypothetical protein
MSSKLAEARSLADQLSPLDQVRLMAHLTTRLAQTVTAMEMGAPSARSQADEAWRTFWRTGDALSASDTPESPTLTAAVSAMRR